MKKPESLREARNRVSDKRSANSTPNSTIQWRVWLGVFFVIIMSIMNWQWAWGILFLIWVIPDIRNRVTYFIEPVEREQSPFLYWTIVITWIVLSLFSLSTLFIDYSQYYY